MTDSTRPATEEDWVYWQKLVSDEHDRQVAENDRLRDTLVAVRDLIENDPDNLNIEVIVDTVWISPTETLVDYIDAALEGYVP